MHIDCREYDGLRAFGCSDGSVEDSVLLYVNAYCFPDVNRVAAAAAQGSDSLSHSRSSSPEHKRLRLADETQRLFTAGTSASASTSTSGGSNSAHSPVCASVPPSQQQQQPPQPGHVMVDVHRERDDGAHAHSLADVRHSTANSTCVPRFPAHFQVLLGQLSIE